MTAQRHGYPPFGWRRIESDNGRARRCMTEDSGGKPPRRTCQLKSDGQFGGREPVQLLRFADGTADVVADFA